MLTFLFGVGVIAATLLLIAVALDDIVRRARERRSPQLRLATASLVSISLARAGAVRAPSVSNVPPTEKKAA